MNYSQSIRFLDSFLNLEKLSQLPQNSFFNLWRMEHLLKISGHAERQFLPVLIAGTTGKGSTGFFLESILRANHVPAGYYHSPHVEDVRERIRIDGRMASKTLWAAGLSRVRALLSKRPLPRGLGALTDFEITTFLAFLLFAETKRRVGIFEIGLGGRLDATNVLQAPLVVLTPIHLDHEHFLGNTVGKIAAEKAGIIKKKCFVVTGRQLPEALRIIEKAARKKRGYLRRSKPLRGIPIGLRGDFQKKNAGTALEAAEVLRAEFGVPVARESYRNAFKIKNWPGRMERFRRFGREFILDGAHNPISAAALVRSLHPSQHRVLTPGVNTRCWKGWVVFGAMQDKNSKAMLKELSRHFRKIIVTGIANNRAKTAGMLLEEAKNLFKCVLPAQNTGEALRLARKVSDPSEPIVVTGSFYLAGEARKLLKTERRRKDGG